jgi:hypothetical protein
VVLPLVFTCGKDDDDDGGLGSSSGGTGGTGSETDTGATSSGGTSSGDTSSGGTTGDGGTTSGSSGTTGSTCGNGQIDVGEDCDGDDLQDETCESLGEGTGTLSCDPVTCTFDTSMCSGNGSSTSGG